MTDGGPAGDLRIGVWRRLMSNDHAELRQRAAATDPTDPAAIMRLRRLFDADAVSAALELAKAREKARRKMPDIADAIVADPAGVEMASSTGSARWKAARFAERGGGAPVFDVCCGIGGDAIELVRAGLDVAAVEIDPLRAWMTERNAGCKVLTGDIEQTKVPTDAFIHVDPSRRDDAGRRRLRLEDMTPPPDVVRNVIERAQGSAVKLAPGVDPRRIATGESEFISERGRLTQAVLWTGALAECEAHHRATMLPGRETIAGAPMSAPTTPNDDAWLFTTDPALERARLVGHLARRHGLRALDNPATGLLTGPDHIDDPWVTAYRRIERMPWNLKRVRTWLAARGAGIVTVKTRGGAVDPDRVASALRGPGDTPLVVFVQRIGRGVEALVCDLPGP